MILETELVGFTCLQWEASLRLAAHFNNFIPNMATILSCTMKMQTESQPLTSMIRHLLHNHRGEEIERKEGEIESSMCEALALKSTRLSSLSASHMFFVTFCRCGKLQTVCLGLAPVLHRSINYFIFISFGWLVEKGRSSSWEKFFCIDFT